MINRKLNKHDLSITISFLVLFVFTVIPERIALFLSLPLFICLYFLYYKFFDGKALIEIDKFRIQKIGILFVALNCLCFVYRWSLSSMISNICIYLHVDKTLFLVIVSLLFGIISYYAIIIVFVTIKTLVFKISRRLKTTFNIFVLLSFSVAQYILVQYSTSQSFDLLQKFNIYFFVNIMIVVSINMIIAIVVRSIKTTIYVTTILFSLWSIANYYVIQFHGSPLFISEFENFQTTMAVINGYSIELSSITTLCFSMCVKLIIYNKELCKSYYANDLLLVKALIVFGIVIIVFFASFKGGFGWNAIESVYEYGFFVNTVEDLEKSLNPINKPDGYNIENLQIKKPEKKQIPDILPDIILILNETFCDINYYSPIECDINCFDEFYLIENAKYGYTASPGVGGGTNNSEFELLTSKSTFLLNNLVPFNNIDFNNGNEPNGAMQYLKMLGYNTCSMHACPSSNYNRKVSYMGLGFDDSFFDNDMLKSSNGNRNVTDESNYKDLIKYFEDNIDKHNFLYLLTFQNHGGYNENDEKYDTVHTTEDFGELTDDINEYLSSLELSSRAFRKLINYFSSIKKPVVVFMMGDHAPSFISQITSNIERTSIEESIAKRIVPYVVWSNYDIDLSNFGKYISMVDVIPLIFDSLDLPMSSFYNEIVELHKEYPLRIGNNIALDSFENVINNGNKEFEDRMHDYYCLEYNSLDKNNFIAEYFVPNVIE